MKRFVKSNREKETVKIIFQFFLMSIASVAGGICLAHMLDSTTVDKLSYRLSAHFASELPQTSPISFLFGIILRTELADLLCIALLLIFSFSFINYFISDIILVFLGVRYGINSAIIFCYAFTVVGLGNSLCYWLCKGVLLVLILIFACKIAILSLKLRRFTVSDGRIRLDHATVFSMLKLTFSFVCATFLFNGLYCLFIYAF